MSFTLIHSPSDLAALAQVYRDPRFETFRAVFVKDGEVVGESAYSSRLPGQVQLPTTISTEIADDQKRYGADGYYLLHNHPGGRAIASEADANLTARIFKEAPGMISHVIVDHVEYGIVNPDGTGVLCAEPSLSGPDYHNSPSLDHPLLGVKIGGPKDMAIAAKALQAGNELGNPVLIMTKGSFSEVELIASAPMALIKKIGDKTARASAWLRGIGRASGAGCHRFLVVSDKDFDLNNLNSPHRKLIRDGMVTDVVSASGVSLRDNGVNPGYGLKPLFDTRRAGIKAAEPEGAKSTNYTGPKYAIIRSMDEYRHLVESNTGERIGVYPTVEKAKQVAESFEKVWMKEHLKELKIKQKNNPLKVSEQEGGEHLIKGGIANSPGLVRKLVTDRLGRVSGQWVTNETHTEHSGGERATEATAEAERYRQYDEVDKRYRGTPQWLKAPNGEPTKLTERQWIQVRTPNFKNWFGDWEAAKRQSIHRELVDRALSDKQWQKRALIAEGYDSDPSGKLSDTFGFKIERQYISPDDLRKIEDRHGIGKEKDVDQIGLVHDDYVKAMEVLRDPEAFRKTVSNNGKPSAEFYRRFTDGTIVVAEVEVAEKGSVSLKSIWKKIPGGIHADVTIYPNRTPSVTAGVDSIVHSDTLLVNHDTVSKVVDANGEPLVMYHGTPKVFPAFNTDNGAYFIPKKQIAEKYAGRTGKVIEAFISAQKVAKQSDLTRIATTISGKKNNTIYFQKMRDEKFQLFAPMGMTGEVIALTPESIKSATDNNGDFSLMKTEFNKSLGNKRILFFKSQISAYTTKLGVFVPAHTDKRTKRSLQSGKDEHTLDMFAPNVPPTPKRDIPVAAMKKPEDFTPDLLFDEINEIAIKTRSTLKRGDLKETLV
jgi:hypothetical protein